MDISSRVIKYNILSATLLAAYFFAQMQGGIWCVASFVVVMPLMTYLADCLVSPCYWNEDEAFPTKPLFRAFVHECFGFWGTLVAESLRRIVVEGFFVGFVSFVLMLAPLLVFMFSGATGVLITNTGRYKRGSLWFVVLRWGLIAISLVIGSAWGRWAW